MFPIGASRQTSEFRDGQCLAAPVWIDAGLFEGILADEMLENGVQGFAPLSESGVDKPKYLFTVRKRLDVCNAVGCVVRVVVRV